jgi:hypothetical protein
MSSMISGAVGPVRCAKAEGEPLPSNHRNALLFSDAIAIQITPRQV